jgi:hypothetical protein
MVATVNVALERKLMTLECEEVAGAVFEFSIAGQPVIAHIGDIGFDEVSVKAIVCPTVLGRGFAQCVIHHEFRRYGGATAWATLERRTGKYLQTTMLYHGSKEITHLLSQQDCEPLGYGTKPTATGYDFHKEFVSVFGGR